MHDALRRCLPVACAGDIGNRYGVSAQQMQQNLLVHNKSVPYWRQWSYPMYIEANSDVLFNGIYQTLDGLVQASDKAGQGAQH